MENNKQLLLRNIIIKELDSEIGKQCALFDLPFHTNIGDSLIWQGEIEYLTYINANILYNCSYFTCSFPQLNDNVTIIFHGGGNWGDLYPEHINFLKKIIQIYPQNKIVVMPQTVYYKDSNKLKSDINEIEKHKHITICARDFNSYELLKNNSQLNIKLVPDMAFCCDFTKYINPKQEGKKLFIKREDNEINENIDYKFILHSNNIDIKDWPTFNKKLFDGTFLFKILAKLARKNIPISKNILNWYAPLFFIKRINSIGCNFLYPYDEIYTTRLHGCILGILLGKKIYLIDNNYGKNSSFYKTWLNDINNVIML